MRDKLISTAERQFAADCVAVGRRIDGRSLYDARRVSVSLGPSWGFAEVAFDNTVVVASTSVEAITPKSDRGNEGIITISALNGSTVTPTVTETRNCIEKFVRESRAIDTEALCILAGVKVWSVGVDVDIINDDGNALDVCVMAVMSSLMHARRPDVTVTGKEVRVHSIDEREPLPLPIHHVPLSISFALFGAGKPYEPDRVIMDPVKKEEIASGGSLSFAFNAHGEVCGVYKAGGLPLQHLSFVKCSELGEQRALKLTAILKQSLQDASVQHPLATVRPMLVNPEPVAQMKSRESARAERDKAMKDAPLLSMWNATPVDDALPPPPSTADSNPVKVHAVDGVETAVESVFEKRKEVVEVMDVDGQGDGQIKKKIVETIEISDSSSSDDDLQAAVISKPRGGGARG